MEYKTYTREEYLQWCKKNNVKNPLPEYKRNKMTECGYPYIPQMELYDYDKDAPLAKEGDRYKVILIKEG